MAQRSLVGRKNGSRRDRGTARRLASLREVLGLERLEARQLLTVTANPNAYVALEATPLTIASPGVLDNDTSSTGSALMVTGYTQPTDGTLMLATDGAFTYTPKAGYTGPDQFTYTATDARGAAATATVTLGVEATTDEASVFAGTRLASVDSTQGALLNAVLGGLVGTNLNLSLVDYNGLASGSINGGRLADALGVELGVTPAQALTTNASLGQVFTAAATVAQADGNTAEASAFTDLATSVGGVAGTVQLGNLIHANTNDGSLADSSLNALDLASGTVQLFNFANVATTPTPITVSAASLGLPGIATSVGISAQVVEPPVVTTGPAGTQFHTAAIRLRLDLNLNDTLDTSAITAALQAALGGTVTPTVTASLNQLSLYTEVAEGQGTIASIDAIANAVTLQATPGLADVYLGNIANSVFFDRTHVFDPTTDVGYGTVGTLNIAVPAIPPLTPVTNVSTGIQLRAVALGDAPTASTEVFNAPFPQSQTVSTGATFLTNLANTLAQSLSVQLSGSLGTLLDPLVDTAILPALSTAVTGVVTPLLAPVLANVANPTLQQLGTGIGQLDLTVQAVNAVAAPAANPDFATTPEDQAVVVPVLANDASVPGEPISVSAVTQPTHGIAAINADGTITYTPTTGYFGGDAFTYTITDPNGLTSTSNVTVNVLPLAPVALPDTYTATEGIPLTVPASTGVLANDTDPDKLPLTAVIASQPTRGTVTLNPDGSFTYTPTAGDYGPDTFTYQATNGTTLSAPVTVTLDVQPTLPTTIPDAYTTRAGKTLTVPVATGVLANDTDPNGLVLTAVIATQPTHGALTLSPDGSLTYIPTAGYVGPDTFTYQATDANGAGNTATVTITVAPGAPVTNPDVYTTTAGTTLTVPVGTGVLANDTDPNGLALTAVIATQPTHGTVTLSPNGSLIYVPTAGYVGPDTFTYHANDADGTGNTATVTITINAAVTTPGLPTANPDAYTTTEDTTLTVPASTGVLANDTDSAGLPLTAVVATEPTHGTLTLNSAGSLTYVPTVGYTGTDTFTYQASDGTSLSTPTTVSLVVNPGSGNPGTGTGTNTTPTVVTTFPITGTAGVPIVNAPIVTYTDGDGTTPAGSYTATITWGDGTATSTGTITETGGVYEVTGDHTYAVSGTYPVSVTVTAPTSNGFTATTAAVISPVAANASLAGIVFGDTNGDGILEAGEPGIAGATIILAGSTPAGQLIYHVTSTALDGTYSFGGLPAGTYAIAERLPSGAVQTMATATIGEATAGSLGGTASNRLITAITVPSGGAGTGYNFAEAATSSLAGTVFLDANKDGTDDSNDYGVANFVLSLTGTTTAGQAVAMSATSDSSGHYEFAGLTAGTYKIQVARPTTIFSAGAVTPGTAGGDVVGAAIAAITLAGSTDATGYNFAELAKSNCRLTTPAFRTLLAVGPTAALPASFRPVALSSTGPIATYLPTLAARATTAATVATTTQVVSTHTKAKATKAVHVTVAHAVKAHASAVKVEVARAKPHAATAVRKLK